MRARTVVLHIPLEFRLATLENGTFTTMV